MIKADLHCHTIASDHAYSTVAELASYASKAGLEMIAVTDHGPAISDSPHIWHFQNLHVLPRVIDGVKILRGTEANIININGDIDEEFDEETLNKLDVVIASFHAPCGKTGTVEEHTQAYINLIRNPHIDILGHSGTPMFSYDIETVVKEAAKYNKIFEINNHTFHIRKRSIENCVKIAKMCKKHGVYVTVDSDAHIAYALGDYTNALSMLKEIDFPDELILNTSAEKVVNYLNGRTHKKQITF